MYSSWLNTTTFRHQPGGVVKTADPMIIPLSAPGASLALAGGKGRSLVKLTSAGLPVPPGFIVSTHCYNNFIEANNLTSVLLEIIERFETGKTSATTASASIREVFAKADMSAGVNESITQNYTDLAEQPVAVAVRSSATAEDLPGLSFAGQQDSYLNIVGEAALLTAVRDCWASLWTARAIEYRRQMGIDQTTVAMAVVIQVMVQADVSGILFTANPTSGERSELVVNASFGLGEAIVSGQVTPDTYVLDRTSFEAKETHIGSKEKLSLPNKGIGTTLQTVLQEKRNRSSLSVDNLKALAALSLKVEHLFDDEPQDIEWALVNDECCILQSRPITNLPAQPLQNVQWRTPIPGEKLIRRQVVENMPDPLSPLFADLYLREGLEFSLDRFLANLGAPFDVGVLIDRPMFVTVNGYAYCRASYHIPWRILPKILIWQIRSMKKMFDYAISGWRDEGLPDYLATVEEWKRVDPAEIPDDELIAGMRVLAKADAVYWFYISMIMGFAKVTDGLLHFFLSSRLVPGNLISGQFLRGFASKTLEAQIELETIAKHINAIEGVESLVLKTPASELLEKLENQNQGKPILQEIRHYLDRYGHQIYTLDFVQAAQTEDPLPVLLSLKMLVKNAGYDTRNHQAEMIKELKIVEQNTLRSLGPVRRWVFRRLLGLAKTYGPDREEALFYMGAAWPTLRKLALELGGRLTHAGIFYGPDDVFYLTGDELTEACSAAAEDRLGSEPGALAKERRALREARKKLHPPPMVPEQSRWKIGPFDLSAFETQKRNVDDSNKLNGFAVSPGTVTGLASVILSPADFEQMVPDSILVCPTTTPAWTPLFAQASGLVTDIGGILAHGSIVAREYGIPAVMGTGNITQRIVSGQQILVDGDAGTVTILGEADLAIR